MWRLQELLFIFSVNYPKIEEDNNCNSGFAPELHMNLDTTKVKQLGWEPKNDLINMYIDMIDYMKKHIG
mgnify:CR=1 FL=1